LDFGKIEQVFFVACVSISTFHSRKRKAITAFAWILAIGGGSSLGGGWAGCSVSSETKAPLKWLHTLKAQVVNAGVEAAVAGVEGVVLGNEVLLGSVPAQDTVLGFGMLNPEGITDGIADAVIVFERTQRQGGRLLGKGSICPAPQYTQKQKNSHLIVPITIYLFEPV
jgi:hypothetical protein